MDTQMIIVIICKCNIFLQKKIKKGAQSEEGRNPHMHHSERLEAWVSPV
jgi:hypothetical protein